MVERTRKICGIVGVAGRIHRRARDAFDDLLWTDALRGSDGTGLATVSRDKVIQILKTAGNTAYLRQIPKYKELLGSPTQLLLGHNRAKTRGGDTPEELSRDAHPFRFGDIVGAHNGTLSKRSQKALEGGLMIGMADTDSAVLLAYMAENTVKETLDLLEGDSAIVWYNRFENTLNMWRNSGRPMWVSYSGDYRTMMFASESDMIYLVTGRNELQFSAPRPLMEDRLYKFELPKRRHDPFGPTWSEPYMSGSKFLT